MTPTIKSPTAKSIIYGIMLILTAFIVIKLFPQNNCFDRNYEIGKPWQYELLTAPFDFPIYKSDNVIAKEKDSLMQFFTPYYKVGDTTAIDDIIQPMQTPHKQLLAEMLNKIYEQGVVSHKEYEELVLFHTEKINVSNASNICTKLDVKNIQTTYSAINQLSEQIPFTHTDLQHLTNTLKPNLIKDNRKSELAQKELFQNISSSEGIVKLGERIIDKGEIVLLSHLNILNSLKKEYNIQAPNKNSFVITLAHFFIILALLGLFALYLSLFREQFIRLKNALFLTIMALIIIGSAAIMAKYNDDMINIVPFSLIAIIIRIFFDGRTAITIHNIVVLIVAIFIPTPFMFVLLHITAGMIAVSTLKQLSHRKQLIQSAILIFITYAILYTAYSTIDNGSFIFDIKQYGVFAGNSLLLLFAYPLIYIFEKLFGYLSDVTLMELSNMNNKLLLEFSSKSAGSFHHSIQVATLATAIAQKIDANMLLARTGALYHDIGKMKNAMYFIENQVYNFNPLNDKSYKEAANIITAHITDGVDIAERHHLPKQIIRFIKSHHARSTVKYFYIMAQQEKPNETIDKSDFTYKKGILPYTKEETIVMMSDAVEAASRTLNEYSEDNISSLVDNIIKGQIEEGSFKQSPMTFRDVEIAKEVLKEKIKNIYHNRIEYPK